MDEKRITRKEQSCISNCIFEFWGDREDQSDPETRDQEYEQCLSDCRVCA